MIDCEICRRRLAGQAVHRSLTMQEKAAIYRAVIAGGGNPTQAGTLCQANGRHVGDIADYVEATGGVDGFPMVDGVTLMWRPGAAA